MHTRIFHLQALSALHVGTGQGVGTVDLPIARSRATNLPLVPGSALKGVLRDEAETQWKIDEQNIKVLFGPKSDEAESHAGAVAFGDAHLLLLPIRSFAGTFAYATCPFILQRYRRDIGTTAEIPTVKNQAALTNDSELWVEENKKIALEDLDLPAQADNCADAWAKEIAAMLYPESMADSAAWREQLLKRFVILPDNEFSFLADTATEIRTRIRIDRKTRIVANGALWSEENLPAETVLWGVMGISKARNKDGNQSAADLSALIPAKETHVQIGGKHTVGRGLCRLVLDNHQEAAQ